MWTTIRMEDTVAFPTQEYLRERSTMLHYAYLAYIVKKKYALQSFALQRMRKVCLLALRFVLHDLELRAWLALSGGSPRLSAIQTALLLVPAAWFAWLPVFRATTILPTHAGGHGSSSIMVAERLGGRTNITILKSAVSLRSKYTKSNFQFFYKPSGGGKRMYRTTGLLPTQRNMYFSSCTSTGDRMTTQAVSIHWTMKGKSLN